MSLIDKYLPQFNFTETHSIVINSSQEKCYYGTMQFDLSKPWIIKTLFKLRGLPVSAQRLSDFASKMKFTLLEENKFQEFLFGFWVNKNGIERVNDSLAFINNDTNWKRKVVWYFEFNPISKNITKVTTTTRVKNITTYDKTIFSIYWFFIQPFSGLIRKIMLKELKKELELNYN